MKYKPIRQSKIVTITSVIIGLFMLFECHVFAEKIKPFKSDGCSLFPEGSPEQKKLWLECCIAHDYAYWKGGTFQQRLEADLNLKACVEKVADLESGLIMFTGVRVGGTPLLPTPFRWGYGWRYPRFYKQLSSFDIQYINSLEEEVERGSKGQ